MPLSDVKAGECVVMKICARFECIFSNASANSIARLYSIEFSGSSKPHI